MNFSISNTRSYLINYFISIPLIVVFFLFFSNCSSNGSDKSKTATTEKFSSAKSEITKPTDQKIDPPKPDDSKPISATTTGTDTKNDNPTTLTPTIIPADLDLKTEDQDISALNKKLLINAKVDKQIIQSELRQKLTYYYIFESEKCRREKNCPVLYLLHGAYDDYEAWYIHAKNELLYLSDKYSLIIVTPDGEQFGWYADSKNSMIESYFFNELIPDINAKFINNGLKSIAGLSMGGHGAVTLALRHPDEFVSASSMSGILNITKHPKSWNLDKVFGELNDQNRSNWEAHSAVHLAKKNKEYTEKLPLYITTGKQDKLAFADNKEFSNQMSLIDSQTYLASEGGHDWKYWVEQLPRHLEFHSRILNKFKPNRNEIDSKPAIQSNILSK
ncbi:MAG: esterase family protein [Deltaproteobacteria bacterium]|nr:esterase family protein [Deltaproteobacteria bacterium]